MLASVLSRFILRYISTASDGASPGDVVTAADSSCSRMIMNEDERVTKSTKLSAGRLRDRCADTERRRAVKV